MKGKENLKDLWRILQETSIIKKSSEKKEMNEKKDRWNINLENSYTQKKISNKAFREWQSKSLLNLLKESGVGEKGAALLNHL